MAEKILIIDDDLDTLRLVGLMLEKQGYQIAAANNGEQGLLKVKEENPDLILLDVMMPDMDGYEVSRRLRQDPSTASIPILMFTAKSQLDDKVSGFESGADDYLTKPTHPTELHAHVKALLARSIKAQVEAAVADKKAFIVGVLSVRGGLGVSAVALNLGSYLQSEMDADTIVAEMTPGMGTIGRDLGFENYDEFSALLKSAPDAIDNGVVSDALNKHKSGLKLLLASEQPREYPLGESLPQYNAIFKQLVGIPRFLILDLGASLPRVNQTILPQCDHVIVLVEAAANTLTHTKLLLEDLLELGVKENNLTIVMNNRVRSDMLLSLSQVEKALEKRIGVTFTPAPELHTQAIRMKTTAVLVQKESMSKQQFKNLAEIISAKEAQEE